MPLYITLSCITSSMAAANVLARCNNASLDALGFIARSRCVPTAVIDVDQVALRASLSFRASIIASALIINISQSRGNCASRWCIVAAAGVVRR